MTTKEFITKQRKKLNAIQKENKPLAIAATSIHSKQVQRVFEEGKNSKGTKIGIYDSSNSLYVNPKNAPRSVPLKGKTGRTAFKSGKRHVTGYFPSYKAFRQQQGRPTSFVNLTLFGRLKSDYSRPPQRVNVHRYIAGVNGVENTNKIKGVEDKYGRVFFLTQGERKQFLKILEKELVKAFQ